MIGHVNLDSSLPLVDTGYAILAIPPATEGIQATVTLSYALHTSMQQMHDLVGSSVLKLHEEISCRSALDKLKRWRAN